MLEEQLVQEFHDRRERQDLTRDEIKLMREELVQRYSDHITRAPQPYMDLFVNLTIETEEEINFDDEGVHNLTEYGEGYEWTEERYLRLRFRTLRHIANQAYHNDAYAYLVRTRPDELENARQIYRENREQTTNIMTSLEELQRHAEMALEEQAHMRRRGYSASPPEDVLIPPSRPTMAAEMGQPVAEGLKPPAMVLVEPQRKTRQISGGGSSRRSSSSPDEEAQKEDRNAAIEAVRKITGASKGTAKQRKGKGDHSLDITGTPGYEWDARYDGVPGFPTQLRNRVSDPSTPQRRISPKQAGTREQSDQPQSPREGETPLPSTPMEPLGFQEGMSQNRVVPPKQILIYDETPTGRPLPTLRDIRQANLRKILEEEGAETQCDICGAPSHDYQNCPKGRYLESQDPSQDLWVPESPYCGWCQQYGHISKDCLAKYYDNSMRERFPPQERKSRKPLRQYDCRRCGQKHPFNVYCPYITQPPVVPGECKSCGAVTNLHDEDCQYVEVKDEIGICSYCGKLDHSYAQCSKREQDKEAIRREGRKDKKTKKKGKAKVKIVSGILTRKRDSETSSSSERGEPPVASIPPCSRCSFCGNNTHEYTDCPMLHQFVRQQADDLADLWAQRYQAAQAVSLAQQGEHRGQTPRPKEDTRGTKTDSVKEKKQPSEKGKGTRRETKGLPLGGWQARFGLPPAGGSGPPPGGGDGGPPDDHDDEDESDEEEGEETDEDTISVTSSSVPEEQVQRRHQGGGPGGGGPPGDPNDPTGGGVGGLRRGPRGHRGQRGRTGQMGREGPQGPIGPVGPIGPAGPRGIPGRDGTSAGYPQYSTPATGIIPPAFNANLSTIGMENSFHYLGESLLHLAQFQQNVNRNIAGHLLSTAKSQKKQKEALQALVENTRQREFDKLFDAIPLYDGEDPDKFEPWLSQLENAYMVGKRDIREVAICSSVGPVLEVLNSIDDKEDWAIHRDELRRCFSTNKTRVHAADLT